MTTDVTIPGRFNGPPQSANGGYACGLMARALSGVVQARLHVPPPLDTPLALDVDGGAVTLRQGEIKIGSARAGALETTAPAAPNPADAEAGVARFRGFQHHAFPSCFVCGPDREAQDGLRLFTGPIPAGDAVASPWTPPADLVVDGRIPVEILWAALDCPSFFGLQVDFDRPFLLGQMTADIPASLPADRAWIVYGWRRGQDGRKHFSGAALADETGRIHARAEHIWFDMADR